MKLYEIPEGSKLKLETERGIEMAIFHHLDGAYSYITLDKDGAVVHLSASTPMQQVGDYYEIES